MKLLTIFLNFVFYYKFREMKKKIKAYKMMIPNFGYVTLVYLLTWYEDMDEEEAYIECAAILQAIEEYEKEHGLRNIPKRFTSKLLREYAEALRTTNEDIALKTLRANASKVRKFVEDNG